MLRYYRFILLLLLISLPQIMVAQWEKFQLFDETVIYKSIHVAKDTFYVSGGTGLYVTFDAGNTWIKHSLDEFVMLSDINFFNSKVGVAVGSIGGNSATAMKTFDGGKTWTISYVSNVGSVIREINDVEFIDNLNGYAVGANKVVIKTTDGGNTWTNLNPIVENNSTGIKMRTVNQGFIVSKKFILGFDGLSTTETKLVAGTGNTVVDIKIIDEKNLIVALNDKISKSSDGGNTWTHFTFPFSQINSMFVLNPQNIYVGTNNGVYISIDGGGSWEIFKETAGKIISTIAINPDGKGIALGIYGDAFKIDNFGGASAPIISFELSQKNYCNVSSLNFAATNTRDNYSYNWLLGDRLVSTKALDSVRFTTNSSSTLSLVCSNGVASDTLTKSFNVDILDVKANAGTDIYACSNEPIQLAATGGADGFDFTWTPNTGLTNPKIKNPIATNIDTVNYVVSVANGECVSKDTVVIFRNASVSRFDFKKMNIDQDGMIGGIQMVDENIGYAVGGQGLYKTTDGGFSWSKTFYSVHFSGGGYGDVEFISHDVGYFASVYLYKTTDGGKTATELNINYVADIEFLNSNVGYVATNNGFFEQGEILRTVDGGDTWTIVYNSQLQSGYPNRVEKIKCFPSGRCVAIGYDHYSHITFLQSDDGIIWKNAAFPESISSNNIVNKYDISFIDDNVGYATGGSHILKTTDGGKSWKLDSQLTVLDNTRLVVLPPSQVTFIDSQNGFAVVWSWGNLYRTVNGGVCWENLGQIGNNSLIDKLYISKNKKIFLGVSNSSFTSKSIYQADYLLPKKIDQTIEFSIQSPKTIRDGSFKLGAVASSTLPITYEISDESIASISGDILTIRNIGTIQITAKQTGNDSYNPAMPVSRNLTIIKVPQVISFTIPSQKFVTDPPFNLVGSSTSGLPIVFSSSDESVISISEDKATIKNAGTAQIIAKQVGDDIFDVAPPVVQNLEVEKFQQNIIFDLSPKQYGDPDFALDAKSDSGIPITYSIENNSVVDLFNGNMIQIKSAGSTNITATAQSSSIYYEASVTKNLEISPITGIEESPLNRSTIYPNPADRNIVINLDEVTSSTTTTIVVYDMMGRDLSKFTTTATEQIIIDVSNFYSGIYFVRIIHENEMNILKFIKR